MRKRTGAALGIVAAISCLLFLVGNRLGGLIDVLPGNILQKFTAAVDHFIDYKFTFFKTRSALILGGALFLIAWAVYLYRLAATGNFRRGEEYGSSRWGTAKDIKPLMDPDPELNIPLSDLVQISSRKVKDFEADRNKNIVVVGGSGSGKTYSEVKPSLMQLHSSYVITDPKGTLLPETGRMLQEAGYEIRVMNTINFTKSMHYNPLAYIRDEKDILKVVNVLIENTKGEGNHAGEDFWVKAERLLYTALIAYIFKKGAPEERNIPMLIDLLDSCEVRDNDPSFRSAVDILFESLEAEDPDCLAVKQYKKFKMAAGDTMKSILISCAARLAPFDIAELREITSTDELQLDELGDRKTALYLIMSDTDSTYSFLIAMIMYQMFNLLCTKADDEYGGHLPFPVRCLLDEFANIGKIPDFQILISTIRSRGISVMIFLQSLSQLDAQYKDNAEIILDNCDTLVFLGGKSTKTTEQISKMIGKTTIDTQNTSETKGQSGSYSMQNQILGRDLIDPAEIARLKRSDCIVLITGLPPFRSKKYRTQQHPRYHQIADGGAALFDPKEIKEQTMDSYFAHVKEIVKISELNDLD